MISDQFEPLVMRISHLVDSIVAMLEGHNPQGISVHFSEDILYLAK